MVKALAEAFGDELEAVVLTGSAAVEGAYRDGVSDVDVMAIVGRAEPSALEHVVSTCAHEALPCPAVKLELVVYERAAVTTPADPPRWSLNFDTGAGVRHVGFDPAAEPSHWFVLDLAFARRHGRALAGPPPRELIGQVDDAAIARALDEAVDWYEKHDPGEAETARRRAEHWRSTGTFMTKAGATLGEAPP